MSKSRKSRISELAGNSSGFGGDGGEGRPEASGTGRFLVLLREDAVDEGVKILKEEAGMKVASSADFPQAAMSEADVGDVDAIVFDKLGVVVAAGEPQQARIAAQAARERSPILAVEPERIVYALGRAEGATLVGRARAAHSRPGIGLPAEMLSDLLQPPPVRPIEAEPAPAPPASPAFTADYLRGYRDAVESIVEHLLPPGRAGRAVEPEVPAAALDESQATWGLQATRVAHSRFTGRGVRVCILDTGFDLGHPDFAGRQIRAQSFVTGQSAQDGHGHGTHCTGTACGPQRPGVLPRYGVASASDIYIGKVLSDRGIGYDGWILAGINWAVANKCTIVSMSLGSPTQAGQPFSTVYEIVARRALRSGTLIIAAAGNDSQRQIGVVKPVAHPANCPSIAAVAALDARLQVAWFSNRGLNPQGGQVDIAAPGVDVHSSYPVPTRYRRLNGTSMATPHVAGIAALLAEANPWADACDIWRMLLQTARRLPLASSDVGAGIVEAP